MTSLNFKHAVISAATVYAIGILAYVSSYFIPLLDDPDYQANLVLMLAIIPAACLGAHLYYRKGYGVNGFLLGGTMFLGAMVLDALITVPLFIIPNGGNYISFFGDPGFWLIGVEYIAVVAAYRQFGVINRQENQVI
ncbi:DUF5367 family protein [Owenweeksia hongkongensis]|uniref:DUF5367 family protein n=1 Tax=Owenweeksia hongkongensis TaxID=253245 RepID=UPI003A8D00CD